MFYFTCDRSFTASFSWSFQYIANGEVTLLLLMNWLPSESLWADREVEIWQVEFFLDALKRVRVNFTLTHLVYYCTEQPLNNTKHNNLQPHYSLSQKIPEVFWYFFPKRLPRLGIFSRNLTNLLYVPIYAEISIFMLLSAILPHYAWPPSSHHRPMFKMPTIGRNVRWHFLTFSPSS